MQPEEQIDNELVRLREELDRIKNPDPLDITVLEALSSAEIRAELLPILSAGAHLTGVVMEFYSTTTETVELTFCSAWDPGTSHLAEAPKVTALMNISPPGVLKVTRVPTPQQVTFQFERHQGSWPMVLRNLSSLARTQSCARIRWEYREAERRYDDPTADFFERSRAFDDMMHAKRKWDRQCRELYGDLY